MIRRGLVFVVSCAAAAALAPNAAADPLPDCAAQDLGVGTWSCQAQSHDGSGVRFEVGYGPEPDRDEHADWRRPCQAAGLGWRTTVRVVDAAGAVRQTFAQDGYKRPQLQVQDFDHDGRDELLISPSWGGTGGDTWCVWRAAGDSGRFEPAGEIFAASRVEPTDDGFMKWFSKSGAGGKVLTFGRFVDGKVKTFAQADWAGPGWEDNTSDSWRCLLDKSTTDLAALGMDEEAAQERFCDWGLMWK